MQASGYPVGTIVSILWYHRAMEYHKDHTTHRPHARDLLVFLQGWEWFLSWYQSRDKKEGERAQAMMAQTFCGGDVWSMYIVVI